jgi:uncharacterized membrane protein
MVSIGMQTKAAIAFAAAVLLFCCTRYVVLPGDLVVASLLWALGLAATAAVISSTFGAGGNPSTTAVMLTAVAWITWLVIPTERLSIEVRFWLDRSSYDNAVSEAASGKVPACVAIKTCKHEPTSEVTLAFPWTGALGDWVGVVYYPSGGEMNVERFKGIFGGDLVECVHLHRQYHFCSFT